MSKAKPRSPEGAVGPNSLKNCVPRIRGFAMDKSTRRRRERGPTPCAARRQRRSRTLVSIRSLSLLSIIVLTTAAKQPLVPNLYAVEDAQREEDALLAELILVGGDLELD